MIDFLLTLLLCVCPAESLREGETVYLVSNYGRPKVTEVRVVRADGFVRPSGPRKDIILECDSWDGGTAWYSAGDGDVFRSRAEAEAEVSRRKTADTLGIIGGDKRCPNK